MFLEVKFSIYLKRRVFVMVTYTANEIKLFLIIGCTYAFFYQKLLKCYYFSKITNLVGTHQTLLMRTHNRYFRREI